MAYDPILIAPFKSGLSNYYKPFLIGNDAFVNLENCYQQRGKIKKREGSTVLVRSAIWNTVTSITNASPPVVTTTTNHGLASGDMVYIEDVLITNGTIATIAYGSVPGTMVITGAGAIDASLDGKNIVMEGVVGLTMADGSSFNGTIFQVQSVLGSTFTIFATVTGTYVSGGFVYLANIEELPLKVTVTAANTFTLQTLAGVNLPASGVAVSGNIYLPIVGTRTFLLTTTGAEQLIVFNPKMAYLFTPPTLTNISFDTTGTPILWTGTKDNFFYTSNYFSVMWATNNVDFLRFYNGSPTAGWSNMQPLLSGSTTLTTTLLVMPYKGRLVILSPTESTSANPIFNRARWTQIGTPFAGLTPPIVITGAVRETPIAGQTTITATNTFTAGQTVGITDITGTIGNSLNGNSYTVVSSSGTAFVITVTSFGTYTSGGQAQLLVTPPSGAGVDINAWRSDIPGKGGFADADTSEHIVSAEIINDTMIVGFQFSTWRLRFSGNEILPFIWERIDTQMGSEATFSSINFHDRALMISRRGIIGATFNDVERIDMAIPEFTENFTVDSVAQGLNIIQGIRDFEKRMVYWIYCDGATDAETPNRILCFNYQDNTWAQFNQSFTCLGLFKNSQDNTWSTWTTIWDGDQSLWSEDNDQTSTIIVVAGDVSGRIWEIMDDEVSTDNGVNYNFTITTNIINPYFQQGKRCKLAFYDLYMTASDNGQITVQNATDDGDSFWIEKTVNTSDMTQNVTYKRVFLGMTARNHQITITMSPAQLEDPDIGGSDFEIQGIILHTRMEGRIKH